MSGSPSVARWRLEQGVACLEGAQLAARLNPARAEEGLTAAELEGRPIEGLRLLGLATPDPAAGPFTLEDCYVRQRDLFALYAVGADRRAYLEAVWRVLVAEDLSESARPWAGPGVELILSVHTERLEDCVQLAVESRIPSAELLRLSAPGGPCSATNGWPGLPRAGSEDEQANWASDFERLRPPVGPPGPAQTLTAPVCLVHSLRLPGGGEAGYVEAAGPNDVPSAQLAWLATPPGAARVRYAVFRTLLEKGVILRARVRGVFLAAGLGAEEYPRRAAEVYRALVSADPVLGT